MPVRQGDEVSTVRFSDTYRSTTTTAIQKLGTDSESPKVAKEASRNVFESFDQDAVDAR